MGFSEALSEQLPLSLGRVWALASPGCWRAGDVEQSASEVTVAGSSWLWLWLWGAEHGPGAATLCCRSTAGGCCGC